MTRKFLNGIDAGSSKIINAANGTASTDVAAYGQTPAGGNTAGTVTTANGIASATTTVTVSAAAAPAAGQILAATGASAAAWQAPSAPGWSPADDGLLAANFDPLVVATQGTIPLGRLWIMRIEIRSAITVSNVWLYTQTAGSGSTTGTYVGLYGSNGSKIAGSADIASTLIGAAGFMSCALGGSYALSPGYVFAAYVQNGITSPSFYRCTTPAIFGTSSQYRFATSGTSGVGSMPSTVTPSAASALALWAGLS